MNELSIQRRSKSLTVYGNSFDSPKAYPWIAVVLTFFHRVFTILFLCSDRTTLSLEVKCVFSYVSTEFFRLTATRWYSTRDNSCGESLWQHQCGSTRAVLL